MMLSSTGRADDDETLYRKWRGPFLGHSYVESLARQLPPWLFQALYLVEAAKKYSENQKVITEKLLASGYMTKTSVTVTNTASRSPQAIYQLLHSGRKSGVKLTIKTLANSADLVLICRPQDVLFITGQLQSN